eukprot:TRINITY_DN100496_c0_g1_i1.p2 TRINITY_DN100496_c0_g1~~TRINITY_DN100496_c0_g1_i1.p2  ORF type:complete len:56 (+),score=0.04 TRINITY_DN100496_c0_g1_i1:283-450(+)
MCLGGALILKRSALSYLAYLLISLSLSEFIIFLSANEEKKFKVDALINSPIEKVF